MGAKVAGYIINVLFLVASIHIIGISCLAVLQSFAEINYVTEEDESLKIAFFYVMPVEGIALGIIGIVGCCSAKYLHGLCLGSYIMLVLVAGVANTYVSKAVYLDLGDWTHYGNSADGGIFGWNCKVVLAVTYILQLLGLGWAIWIMCKFPDTRKSVCGCLKCMQKIAEADTDIINDVCDIGLESGLDFVESGAGLVKSGIGLVESGADLVDSAAGLVESGADLVDSAAGLVESGAGLVEGAAGLVESGAGLAESIGGFGRGLGLF